MTAQTLSKDGTPIDWCQRCSCAVVHKPIICEDCRVQIAINDEADPKPQPPVEVRIDRKYPVWAATYGAAFDRLLADEMRFAQWPNTERLVAIGDDAKTVADSAVEALKTKEQKQPPACSFCGNHEGDGCCDTLIHGPGGLEICNVCIANCVRILKEKRA